MPDELEAKFIADEPEPLERLTRDDRLGDAVLGAPAVADELDRYLDTPDGRLATELWACRLRERNGRIVVSLKGPPHGGTGGWLHRRSELEGPASASVDPSDWPASDARAFVERFATGTPLVERFRLRQRRTERSVTVGGRRLGTLSIDVVGVEAGAEEVGRLFVVELEVDDAHDPRASRRLDELAGELGARPGLHADPRTKLEHALDLIGVS